eukprot:m51a1_g8250 putative protein folding (345) ;mRNA; r:139190-140775
MSDNRIDLKNIDKGLLKFCLEHGAVDGPRVIPERDPQDYKWLREAFESLDDDVKVMARLVGAARDADFSTPEGVEASADALETLRDYVENIDNANDLPKAPLPPLQAPTPVSPALLQSPCSPVASIGGVAPVVALLEKGGRVRAAAAGVLAALAANNPVGQGALYAVRAVDALVAAAREAVSAGDWASVRACLGALSAATRSSAVGLALLKRAGGVDVAVSLIRASGVDPRSVMRAVLVVSNLADVSSESRVRVVVVVEELRAQGTLARICEVVRDGCAGEEGQDAREKAAQALLVLASGSPANVEAIKSFPGLAEAVAEQIRATENNEATEAYRDSLVAIKAL